MYSIIDVSNWEQDWSKQVTGTRSKVWVKGIGSEQEMYLFKYPKSNLNENWAELISSEIGNLLGLDVMNVNLALNGGKQGVLLDNIQPAGTIMEDGGELIKGIYEDFNPLRLEHYSIDHIIRSVETFGLQSELISMCLFDALIANQDRHCENWAILRYSNRDVRLAPLYDNGAALGFNSDEEAMKEMLTNIDMFHGFTNRSKTLIEVNGKRKPKMSMLLMYLRDNYEYIYRSEVSRFIEISASDIESIVHGVPGDWMSDVQKAWVCKLIPYRSDWIAAL